jgi:hypothetical protein
MKNCFLIFAAAILSGCSSGIVPMGPNTYMVQHSGSSLSSKSAMQAKCLKEANKFCEEKGLVMIPVSTEGRDGLPVPFGHGANCELVFKALPAGTPHDTNSVSK